jgi:hypothetical protein
MSAESTGGIAMLATPDHAEAIGVCVRKVHGDRYPVRLLYDATALARAIADGRLMVAVAMDASCTDVIGMAALERSAYGPTAEFGMLMVLPEHRRSHVAIDLRNLLAAQAESAGVLQALFNEVHAPSMGACAAAVASQRFAERVGVVPCGLTLGFWPDAAGGRRSFVRYGRRLVDDAAARICRLPARHRALALEIFERLGLPIRFADDGVAGGSGLVSAHHEAHVAGWVLSVPRVGSDSATQLRRLIREIQADPQAACAHLDLPLSQAGATELCELAEAHGFFFSGVTPHAFADGHGLRLQWLATAIDPTQLVLLNPLARRIAQHQAQEQFRVRAKASMIAA